MRFLLLCCLTLAATPLAMAQNRASTEQRLAALRTQIAGVQDQIQEARSEEAGVLQALEGIETEISLREELVEGYRAQLDTLRRDMSALQSSSRRLEDEVQAAKQSYRQHARHAYMRGRANDLALVLSAGSVPQMIARARYLRQFAERRRRQVVRIQEKTAELRVREQELNRGARQTQELLTASQFEQQELAERRRQREGLARDVRRRRSQLEQELAQRQSDAMALEGIVRELVAAEQRRLEAARREAETRQGARTMEGGRRTRPTPRAEARRQAGGAEPLPPAVDRYESLSGTFLANKGRIPWPAEGTITGSFGTRTDPVYSTRIESPGIDVTTAPGVGVRTVFDGVVERVGTMSTFGTYALISHGRYTTMYGNLSSVQVKQGQQVRAGQALGRAGTSEQRRGTGIFFALFDGESAVDPVPWLRGR